MNNYVSKLANASLYICLVTVSMPSFADVIAGNLGGPPPGYDSTTGNIVGRLRCGQSGSRQSTG
jgi:hypothetical protein